MPSNEPRAFFYWLRLEHRLRRLLLASGLAGRRWPACVVALLPLLGVLGISIVASGCAAVPPAPPGASSAAQADGDEYEGWLFRRLTGGDKPAVPVANSVANSAAESAAKPVATVIPTPPAAPIEPTGPLIPGPSSGRGAGRSGSDIELLTAPPDCPAGPPPTIPNPLPASPEDSVSITAAQRQAENEGEGFELSDLSPENLYKNVKKAAGYGPNEKIARAAMDEGKALFRDKEYKKAAAKFATAAGRWPDSPLEEDALFLKGESEFFADQYPEAHDTFGGLLKKYSNTRHLDTVVAREFAIGRYWEQIFSSKPALPVAPNVTDGTRPLFDAFGYAVQAYERVRQNDPTGPLADDSLMALGNAYFRHGQFENAAYHYDLLRKEYPNSEHQAHAHVLGLQAKMRVYQGSFYDGSPLNDAEKIAEHTLTQFGDQLGERRERVAKARAQIAEEQANRDFIVGQYYENRKYFGAARLYYQSVIKEHPHTKMAAKARARLEAIGDKPAEPPNRFAWLTDLLD